MKKSAVVEEPFDMVDMRERPAVMPRKTRFQKGSPEAKAYMASIRNNKQGSGFFKKIGKDIKKSRKKRKKTLYLANELVMKRHLYCPLLELLLVRRLVLWQVVLLVAL